MGQTPVCSQLSPGAWALESQRGQLRLWCSEFWGVRPAATETILSAFSGQGASGHMCGHRQEISSSFYKLRGKKTPKLHKNSNKEVRRRSGGSEARAALMRTVRPCSPHKRAYIAKAILRRKDKAGGPHFLLSHM